jgi:polyhydroxyalkanoate synthase
MSETGPFSKGLGEERAMIEEPPHLTAANATAPKKSRRRKAAQKPSAAAPDRASTTPKASAHECPEGTTPLPDFDALARNMARLVEESGKAVAAYIRPIEAGELHPDVAEGVSDLVRTLGQVAERWLSDPAKTIEAQSALSSSFLTLWSNTLRRLSGEPAPAVVAYDPADKRFADPEWRLNPIFDFLRQAYGITVDWADRMVGEADGLDQPTRDKAAFYVRQIAGAIAPSNFIATNPELIRETLKQSGDNLVRGMRMLAEDVEAGKGHLRIRQSDTSKFTLGVNMAATPGKVVFRNDLIELIQYAPTTEMVDRRPLLIVPPWINKYYILDLDPEKSFVRWAVAQGLTVFMVSWVNPDQDLAHKNFEDYLREGILAALDAIEQATGERRIATIGYCVGGTLLAAALAYMAAKGDDRITSATFFAAQVDFTWAGDLKVFIDDARIGALEEKMAATGYLDSAAMASAFNMLRPNDLIWSYVVNNYLKGREPLPFDLLTWNSDSTRMPAPTLSFYLRNFYLDNKLAKGEMVIGGERLDLAQVRVPVYQLATREDHIAPAKSVFTGAKIFGGDVRFVLAGSGHIAGIVNPAMKPKYQYWTGPRPEGAYEGWLQQARELPGTWWPDWIAWLEAQASTKVPARVPGAGKLAPLCDAPGTYVKIRA